MHVFIDTNILLSFFHFSKDELDALNDVFGSHEYGAAKVHLTQQVCDEFRRNRENKIKDALKKFNEIKHPAQLPSFMKGYEEYSDIKKLSADLQKMTKSIMEKVNEDIANKSLLADRLIEDIFSRSEILEITGQIFDLANMRMALGNPPGKNSSIGDAVNWTVLLESVPDGEDLHVISGDGDFYSSLNEEAVKPFLKEEWATKKRSSLFTYRTLSNFMKQHFDGVAFSFDKAKDSLIEDLSASGSFAWTHSLISKLEAYPYFSLKEVERILDAAMVNDQFRYIITDDDISDFLDRIAVPRLASLNSQAHKDILQKVMEEQRERM